MSVSVSTVEAANPAGLLQAAGTLNDKITQLDTTLEIMACFVWFGWTVLTD